MQVIRLITSCGCALVLMLMAGCGDDPNRKPTAPVSVTVSYKGKPVEGALVQFVIVDNPSVGITDAAGKCALKTYETGDGAIIGNNVVTITKTSVDTKNVRPVKPEDADLIGVVPPPILKSLIPQKYSSPATSGLKEEVKKGSNNFTYDLKD